MGSGKSTIGKALAAAMHSNFVDLDHYIELQEKQSISAIFESQGEIYFRAQERKALLELIAENKPSVIALGGGTPCYYDNINAITAKPNASFFLKASIPTLSKRLWKEKAQRPLLHQMQSIAALEEYIGKHLFERNFYYQQANKTILIDQKTEAEVVREIQHDLA